MNAPTRENVVGVILGQDQPTLRMGVVGFEAGVRYVNPDCEVLEAVVGDFNDPAKAKEIALSMYNRGADFVQHIAGASGMGVFTAAKEADRYAFGVGGNQNYIEPDYIVATALRDVNTIVYNEIKALVRGTGSRAVIISAALPRALWALTTPTPTWFCPTTSPPPWRTSRPRSPPASWCPARPPRS